MTHRSPRGAILPVYFFACLMLGGSSRASFANMALQLLAVAILAWAALARPRYQAGRAGHWLMILVAAVAVIIAVQLIPLPPGLWSALPGRAVVARGYDLMGQPRPWLPLSLAPYATMSSALWLLPPLALLAGVLRLGAFRTTWMIAALVFAAFAGVMLMAMQLSAGAAASHWYFYSITNEGVAVGTFANANHMAILLVGTIPFLAALYVDRSSRRSARRARASAGKVAIIVGALVVVLIGIVLNKSLAGVGLGAAAFAASLFVRARFDQPRTRWGLGVIALGAIAAIGIMTASPIHNNLTSAGVDQDFSSRYTTFGNSLRAAGAYFPFGSGVGSFPSVYPAFERPDWVDQFYVNHAHNDYIELALETGLAGIIVLAAFLLWWAASSVAVWRAPTIDPFARAATIASGAILLHSLVDFPLRSPAISALFAFCVAIMVGVRRRAADAAATPPSETADEGGARHLSLS